MKTKGNIAVFVPHAGCPHQCSFCDQRAISGKAKSPTPQEVTELLLDAVARLPHHMQAEIAFFGGSFTAIPRPRMEELLKAAFPFVDGEKITGIRISTRPDAVDAAVLQLLKSYGVTAVELGAQSMDDSVLALNHRGHTAKDVVTAAGLIRQSGLELGLQMMTGLYGATNESDRNTAHRLMELAPDTVRIYPTLVLANTHLETLYGKGDYTPPTLHDTVVFCAELMEAFESKGIRVIKLGLHADSLSQVVAGPCHPALRELCESQVYYQKAKQVLGNIGGQAILRVHPSCLSKMIGQRRQNLQRLANEGWLVTVQGDQTLAPGEIQKGEIICS
ncbi:MAG: radical SAM protein [Clostridia bacterium]|nr:radical SAM protein [Clostridia bacterium]